MEGDRKPFPVVQTEFRERDAQFSPDVKWIAYESNRSGRSEIYVHPFPAPGRELQISTEGGAQVRWRRDGRELFYIAIDGRLMSVPITRDANGSIDAGVPTALFRTQIGEAVQTTLAQQYTPSADGQRFLMNTVVSDDSSSMSLILNWTPPGN